ncbi:MAG: hypothetical protein WCK65_12285 [Rhodospirillaceae bacterium]
MVGARVIGALGTILLIAAGGLVVASADAAEGKQPAGCQQISFRPMVGTPPDGEQEAGMSHGRKVVIMATVKSGLPQNYYMLLNGKRPDALGSGVPKGAESCLKAKVHTFPVKTQGGNCTGERFRVVIYRGGADKTAMLFGLQGTDWLFCNAAKM